MSFSKFITDITDTDDLEGQIVVHEVKCPFCDEIYIGKSANTLKVVMGEHLKLEHRSATLPLIENKFDTSQHLLDTLSAKVVDVKAKKMPVDLWAEMPYIEHVDESV